MSSLRYNGPSPYYKELAELPVPIAAQFINTSVARVSYSIRDLERNVKRSVTKTFALASPEWVASGTVESRIISSMISQDSSEIVAQRVAPSQKRYAILREVSEAGGSKKRYVEVWTDTQLESSFEVTKRHGQFHTDGYLKSFSFNSSETALLYSAESNPESAEKLEDDPYPKFRFMPSLGEQLYTKKRSSLFIFRWRSSVSLTELRLDQPPAIPTLFGQAAFATDTRIYATGYEQTEDGKLLGMKACLNRPTRIWEFVVPDEWSETESTVTCQAVKIDTQGRSSRSPRILFDKDQNPLTLFWLSNPEGGAHSSTMTLHSRDLRGNSGDKILVDTVYDPTIDEFPGLYTEYSLADSPFLRIGGKTYILMQSLWRSRMTLLSVDVEDGTVTDLTPVSAGQPLYSWGFLTTDGSRSVICYRSTPTSPPETVLLTMTQDAGKRIVIDVLDRPTLSPETQKALEHLEAFVLPIPNRYPVETIVIRSNKSVIGPKPVCITIPHGGPHASTTTHFATGIVVYALEGYTVAMPNYTGSTGFGEKYIQDLIGKCGVLDVGDCIASVEELIKHGISEPGRQLIQGGSHGGFLAAHLIGQYPDLFRAAVMRNPVISAGEFSASDITDWSFREFGLQFGPGTHVTPENFATLYAASPIAHIERVKTPVLLLLGEDDLRVPPTQGKGYYHALKGRGRVVETLVFPKESHPIDGVEAGRVSFEAGRDWFRIFAAAQ